MDDSPDTIARDVAAISQMEAVPTLLEVLCTTTGMGFAAVARVTGGAWTACAVRDDILFGLAPGLSNALTHGSAQTPGEMLASTTPEGLVIAVRNYGPSIPGGSIDKIFQPFWRETTSNDRGGLGLGLHICAQIVRGHGGRLSVSSSQEEGTTFTATVPQRESGTGLERATAQPSPAPQSPL